MGSTKHGRLNTCYLLAILNLACNPCVFLLSKLLQVYDNNFECMVYMPYYNKYNLEIIVVIFSCSLMRVSIGNFKHGGECVVSFRLIMTISVTSAKVQLYIVCFHGHRYVRSSGATLGSMAQVFSLFCDRITSVNSS